MNEKERDHKTIKMNKTLPMFTPNSSCSEELKTNGDHPSLEQSSVKGFIKTPSGKVPRVSACLTWADLLGSFKARWGLGRMHYTVDPGLYGLGEPDKDSPVLVTANYKMSFDRLRETLSGRDFWILVLDTNGINVWCAAGKGTFGTMNLVKGIESCGLARIVSHRQLILPQLAGPGVAAHQVKKLSGFKVIYGPIRAKDLTTFLDNGLKATPHMRVKTFTMWERTVLIPVELIASLKVAIIVIPILIVLSGLIGPEVFVKNLGGYGLNAVLAILTSIMAGAILTPLLLPWLPGRAFSMKGLITGLLGGLILLAIRTGGTGLWAGCLEMIGWLLVITAAAMYMAMNFTGASTYTSLSGVRREMRWAVPVEIGAGALGLVIWIGALIIA